MKKRVLNNKKGFTLVELIVVVALMAVVAGTVTPSVYYSTEKKQKNTAEYDAQSVYRNCIAVITDLADATVKPSKPWARIGTYTKMDSNEEIWAEGFESSEVTKDTYYTTEGNYTKYYFNEGWYNEYTRLLVKKLYANIMGLDISVQYYNSAKSEARSDETDAYKKLNAPANCVASSRSTFITAGNKDPYIVIQVINTSYNGSTNLPTSDDTIYLIVSYHNAKSEFVPGSVGELPSDENNYFGAYRNNANNPIVYTYKIRV